MNNCSPLKKNGLFTSPILGLYDKPRQLIVEYYLHWTITFDFFFQQVQTPITTAYCRIPTLDPVVAPKGAGGLQPSCRGVLAPPPLGEPNKGEVILAPNTSHDQPCLPVANPESFLLTQADITSISMQARLVVLCCCYTGRGKVSSEGVIGIARSFLAAGARTVLSTLWPINDWATIELMKKFYEELFKETPVCEALRRAKYFFHEHENKKFQSIRMWAPFTIYGEDVKFEKQEIEEIKKKSREMFDGFVVLP